MRQTVKEPFHTLDAALTFDIKSSPSIPQNSTTPAPDMPLQFENHPQIRTEIRQIVQEKARRIYALKMDKYFLKAA